MSLVIAAQSSGSDLFFLMTLFDGLGDQGKEVALSDAMGLRPQRFLQHPCDQHIL